MKEERPKIELELDSFDRFIGMVGKVSVIMLVGLPLYYYGQLPETIPIHYGADGQPDGFGSKNIIWVFTLIGAATYGGLFWLNKYPHLFNYPLPITKENAEEKYKIATRMIRMINALIVCTFAYLTYATIQMSLGNQDGLGALFLPAFLVLIFGSIGYYLVRMMK
jgi:uncharacterized membrane protein